MHRDIKPENLMLVNERDIHKIKIIDFGLSTRIDKEEYLYKRCGTPGFVAPEIITKGNE
jgi:serine/threonine protein kinase